MKKETQSIRTQAGRSKNREHSAPLYLTSSFIFEDAEQGRALFADEIEGNIYSRFSNPNTTELIEKVCKLEKAEDGFAFATGMAAVFSCFGALLKSGDHIVACRSVFGSTHQLLTVILPKWGITATYVDANKPEEWEKAVQANTRLIYLESPSNPGLEIIDLELVGNVAKKHNLIFVVDNCFATPILQTPADFGAHLMVHSATKYMDGQGRVLGGIVVGSKELINQIRFFARHTGPSMSPFNAWILSKSLETLALRMERHSENAFELANRLENNAQLEWVKYPFLPSHPNYELAKKQMSSGGGILTFCIKGGRERAQRFIDSLKLILFTANLGDTRTIATHPATTTHSKLSEEERVAAGIPQGLIRISVGLENVDDIYQDIQQALEGSV